MKLISWALACLSSTQVWAASFLIDPTDFDQKLKTIESKIKPGDEVLLAPGVYPKARLVLSWVGTEAQPVVFRSQDAKNHAVLDGGGALSEKKTDENESNKLDMPAVIRLLNAKHVVISNIQVKESPGYGIDLVDAVGIRIEQCEISKTWSRALGGSGENLVFSKNTIRDAVLQNENESVFDDKLKTGTTRYWSAAMATWFRSDGTRSKNVQWLENRMDRSWGEGLIALHVDGVKISGNKISNAYSVLLYVDNARDVKIENNFLWNNVADFVRRDEKTPSHGILMAAENYKSGIRTATQNVQITGNTIANVGVGIGFWRDPANKSPTNRYSDVVIAHNLIYRPDVLAISFKEIAGSDADPSINRLEHNILETPRYLFKGTKTAVFIGNPSAWKQSNNVIATDQDPIAYRDTLNALLNGEPKGLLPTRAWQKSHPGVGVR